MRRLWYNGKVVSMDGAMTRYEAVGAEDGKIAFLGTSADALAQGWDEKKDLQGAMVLPGFTDSHMHMLQYAMFHKNVDLVGVDSIETIIRLYKERMERDHPPYIIGMGWNQETMAEGRLVTKQDLDRVSTEIPVFALRACIHVGACNSVMLEMIRNLKGLDEETLGQIDFETGILRENAARLYKDVLPQADDAYVKDLIQLGQRDLNAAGITCVNTDDFKVVSGLDPVHLVELFRAMEGSGELTIRVYEQSLLEPEEFERLLDIYNRYPIACLTIHPRVQKQFYKGTVHRDRRLRGRPGQPRHPHLHRRRVVPQDQAGPRYPHGCGGPRHRRPGAPEGV